VASAWIDRRRLRSGEERFRVRFRLGGAGSQKHHGGIFETRREAEARCEFSRGEIASMRFPGEPVDGREAGAWNLDDVAREVKAAGERMRGLMLEEAQPEGWVYIFEWERWHKVGWTRRMPASRVADYQAHLPTAVELVASLPGSQADEFRIHLGLPHRQTRGGDEDNEWFVVSEISQAFVEQIRLSLGEPTALGLPRAWNDRT